MKRAVLMIAAIAVALPLFAVDAEEQQRKEVKRVIVHDHDAVLALSDGDGPLLRRGYLGVQLMDMTPELREHHGAKRDSGVLVSRVTDDSPAARAGLRVGDIITGVAGEPVSSSLDVGRRVRTKKNGEQVVVEALRNGARKSFTVTVVEREPRRVEIESLGELPMIIGETGQAVARELSEYFESPEWKAKMQRIRDCTASTSRIQELERRLEELEKKSRK